jgi:TonB family protein
VVIPVEVKVSERGRVLSAQAGDQSTDGLRRYLADQAQKAAREWQFTPARTRTGAPVPASKTIEFKFTQ